MHIVPLISGPVGSTVVPPVGWAITLCSPTIQDNFLLGIGECTPGFPGIELMRVGRVKRSSPRYTIIAIGIGIRVGGVGSVPIVVVPGIVPGSG